MVTISIQFCSNKSRVSMPRAIPCQLSRIQRHCAHGLVACRGVTVLCQGGNDAVSRDPRPTTERPGRAGVTESPRGGGGARARGRDWGSLSSQTRPARPTQPDQGLSPARPDQPGPHRSRRQQVSINRQIRISVCK